MKSKSIFQVDWALIIQMEYGKCLEMIVLLNAHFVPILLSTREIKGLKKRYEGIYDRKEQERNKLERQDAVVK